MASGYLRQQPASAFGFQFAAEATVGAPVYNKGPFTRGWIRRQCGGTFESLFTTNLDGNDNGEGSANLMIGYKRQAKACVVGVGRPLVMRYASPSLDVTDSPDNRCTIYARAGLVGPEGLTYAGFCNIPRFQSGGTILYDADVEKTPLVDGYAVALPKWANNDAQVAQFTGGGFNVRVVYSGATGAGSTAADPGFQYWIFPQGMSLYWYQKYGDGSTPSPVASGSQFYQATATQCVFWRGNDMKFGGGVDCMQQGSYFDIQYISDTTASMQLICSNGGDAPGVFGVTTYGEYVDTDPFPVPKAIWDWIAANPNNS